MDLYLGPHHFNYPAVTNEEKITVMMLQELKFIKYIHSGPLRLAQMTSNAKVDRSAVPIAIVLNRIIFNM